jgi:lactate racemase
VIDASAVIPDGFLDHETIYQTLRKGLEHQFTGLKCLVLIPDHTRSLPLPTLFKMVAEILDDAAQLDFMVALGTHPPLSDDQLITLVGITSEERNSKYKHIQILNHAWRDPQSLVSLGVMEKDEVQAIAGEVWHESLPAQIDIRINKAVNQYDQLIILGPTFPHEVVGFSGGAKYLFPGISGPEMIDATHWLGALSTVVDTIGVKHTPVRKMIHAAAVRLDTNITLVALVVDGEHLAGMFIGDLIEAWGAAADASAERHICWVDQPFQRVLSKAPPMYDELWTAAKATYKMEPAMAVGGEVIIFAPHLDEVSTVHGKYIYEAGYHILPYFLEKWDQYKHIPLGVLAHCTHLRGSGVMINGIEKPNISVRLSSKIPLEDCQQLNLGYVDPRKIDIKDWKNREQEGILYVPKAGEILYKLRKPGDHLDKSFDQVTNPQGKKDFFGSKGL